MLFNKQILVVLDPEDTSYLALHRGQLIAQRLECPLLLLWLSEDETVVRQLREQLQGEGMSVSFRCVAEKELLSTLKILWDQQHFGLLIKNCDPRQHSFGTSRDARLLREFSCPVLLVKHDSSWQEGIILAAVDPLKEGVEQQLNQEVLKLANDITQQVSGDLRIAVAAPSVMLAANPALQSEQLIHQHVREAMRQRLESLNISVSQIDVGEGPPEYWVPQVANQSAASLVVIGTRARGGLKGALIGNTAERILHRLNADVLVLRNGVVDEILPVMHS